MSGLMLLKLLTSSKSSINEKGPSFVVFGILEYGGKISMFGSGHHFADLSDLLISLIRNRPEL